MERLNFIINVLIIVYIIAKEMDNIKHIVSSSITKVASINHKSVVYSKPNIVDDNINVLSNADANSEDFLLATCITIDEDGNEEVVDYDLRGDSAAPLNFSMFGGTKEQHYDINIVKSLEGERRSTQSYYAFDQTVTELRRQNKVFKDYVIVARITLDQIKAALNKEVINEKAIVLDKPCTDEDVLLEAINSGIGNTELYKMMLKLHKGAVAWI